jgi:hypothetical protein
MTLTRPPPIHPAELFPSYTQPINQLLNYAGGVQSQAGATHHGHAVAQARKLMEQYAPTGRLRNDSGVAPNGHSMNGGYSNRSEYDLPLSNSTSHVHPPTSGSNLIEHPTQWRSPVEDGRTKDPFLVDASILHPAHPPHAVHAGPTYSQPTVSASLLSQINPPVPLYPLHNPHQQVQSFTQTVNGVTAGRKFVDSYVEDITRQRMAKKSNEEFAAIDGNSTMTTDTKTTPSSQFSHRIGSSSQRQQHQQPRNLAPIPYIDLPPASSFDIKGPSPDPLTFSGSPMKRKSIHPHTAIDNGQQNSPTKIVKLVNGTKGREHPL